MTSHIVSKQPEKKLNQRQSALSHFSQSEKPEYQPENPIIKLQDVAVRYRVPHERIPTFKEYAIRWLRGQIRYHSFWAVQNINLEIFPGEVFGIIGPNGAGKSTLLKVIARVLYPTRGRVRITGRVAPLLELGAGFDTELTGRENVYLNGAILGYTKAQIDTMFPEIVEFSGLKDFINAPLRTYSSGMFARLGFSVATASRPDILIVDEILGVGDAEFQTKSYERIQSFKASGTTILLVSHSLERVEEICSRALWLDHGEIVNLGFARTVVMQYTRRTLEKEEDRLTAERHAASQQPSTPPESHEKTVAATPLPAPQQAQTNQIHPSLETGVEQSPALVPEETTPTSTPEAHSQRWGSHTIEITRVQIKSNLDSEVEQGIFETGQPFVLQMDYIARAPVVEAIFGMAIHRHDGIHITGPNTSQVGKNFTTLVGTGKIIYKIAQLPLLEGLYHVSVAVVNQTDTETYDYHDRLYPFRVVNQSTDLVERYGLLTLNGHWEHERSND